MSKKKEEIVDAEVVESTNADAATAKKGDGQSIWLRGVYMVLFLIVLIIKKKMARYMMP